MGYNIFRKLFKKKPEKVAETDEQQEAEEIEEQDSEEEVSLISLSLSLLESGDFDIKCKWEDESYSSAVMLGELLYHLKTGSVSVYVVNILIKYISENTESAEFLNTAFQVAQMMEEQGEKSPLVRPSQVFKDVL
tara:strand:+ start:108 stop:512 length:405 start_codon:yes stop_codon:yes gene_type:complete